MLELDHYQPTMIAMLEPTLGVECEHQRPVLLDLDYGGLAVVSIGRMATDDELELAMYVHCTLRRGLLVLCLT